MRLLTVVSIASLLVSIAGVVLVLGLYVTEPWATDEATATIEATVVTEPTPTPFQHRALLSSSQVKEILESWVDSREGRQDVRVNDCLTWYGSALHRSVKWWYMSDNSDRWMVTAAGNSCDGVQAWYIDDNTGKVIP
jgi:hypothetical protein